MQRELRSAVVRFGAETAHFGGGARLLWLRFDDRRHEFLRQDPAESCKVERRAHRKAMLHQCRYVFDVIAPAFILCAQLNGGVRSSIAVCVFGIAYSLSV